MPITAQEARALRNADAICFDHRSGDNGEDGASAIRAIRRAENSSTGFEETVTIPVEASRVDNYGPGDGPWVCFAMLSSARYDAVARTLTRHIKAGSVVAFRWARDNSSPVTKEAGIYVDMLDVIVQNGKVADTFRVSTFIGLDNTARMTRRA